MFANDSDRWGASGLNIIKNEIKENLRNYLVFALGTNTDATSKESMTKNIDDLVATAKKYNSNTKIILVAPLTNNDSARSTYDSYREAMQDAVKKYDNVVLADWYNAAKDHLNEYFDDHVASGYSDNSTHPNTKGYEKWLEVIFNALGGSGDCGTGEFVWYPQFVEPKYNGKYSNIEVEVKQNPTSSDSGTVKTTMGEIGCGPFSFAMMANMITSKEITPDEVTRVAIETNSIGIEGSYGAVLTKNLAEHYGFEWEKIDNSSNKATIDDITKHLKNGWMIVTGGAGSVPYTSGGHYIGIRGIESDGKWLIADPGHAEEYSQKSWKPEDVVSAGMNIDNAYAFKSTSGTCNNGSNDDTNYCSGGGNTSGGVSGGGTATDKPIEPVHEDSTNIKCDPRTKDVGTRDDAYYQGNKHSIRLCALPNVPDRDGNDYGINDGLTHVNSRVSGAFFAMAEEYNSKCQSQLVGNDDYRTYAYQEQLWYEYGQNPMRVAHPGYSNHEEGLAVDFDNIHSCNDPSISTGSWVNVDFVNKYGLEDSTQGWGDTVEYWHIQAIGSNKQ